MESIFLFASSLQIFSNSEKKKEWCEIGAVKTDSLILLVIYALSVNSPRLFDCFYKLFIGALLLQMEFFSYRIWKNISQSKSNHDKM